MGLSAGKLKESVQLKIFMHHQCFRNESCVKCAVKFNSFSDNAVSISPKIPFCVIARKILMSFLGSKF